MNNEIKITGNIILAVLAALLLEFNGESDHDNKCVWVPVMRSQRLTCRGCFSYPGPRDFRLSFQTKLSHEVATTVCLKKKKKKPLDQHIQCTRTTSTI